MSSQDYFVLQRLILKCIGLSLRQDESFGYKIYSVAIICFMVMYSVLAFPELFKYKDDFDEFIKNLLFQTAYCIGIIKLLTTYINRRALGKILDTLQGGVFVPNPERGGDVEEVWINDCIALTTKLTIGTCLLGFSGISAFAVVFYGSKNARGELRLPLGSFSAFGAPHQRYKMTYFYQISLAMFGYFAYVSVDLMSTTVLIYICVQCRILQNSITKIIENSYRNMKKDNIAQEFVKLEEINTFQMKLQQIPGKYLEQALKDVIFYHTAILQIVEEAKDIFNLPMLVVFIGLCLSSSFLIYHALLYSILDIHFIMDVMTILAALIPATAMSYWGNQVKFESEAVADACYKVDFVGTDLGFQKSLMFITMRSQKPISLNVGYITTLSLETLLGVCKASYSYYMFLKSMS